MPDSTPDLTSPFVAPTASQDGIDVGYTVVDQIPDIIPIKIQAPPSGGKYDVAGISITYNRDLGLRGSPVAGPFGTQAVFWRCHGGMCMKIVSWALGMTGADPPTPSPVTGENEVLFWRTETLPNPEFAMDYVKSRIKAGIYVYLLQKCPADTDILYGGVNPLDLSPITDNIIDPAN